MRFYPYEHLYISFIIFILVGLLGNGIRTYIVYADSEVVVGMCCFVCIVLFVMFCLCCFVRVVLFVMFCLCCFVRVVLSVLFCLYFVRVVLSSMVCLRLFVFFCLSVLVCPCWLSSSENEPSWLVKLFRCFRGLFLIENTRIYVSR